MVSLMLLIELTIHPLAGLDEMQISSLRVQLRNGLGSGATVAAMTYELRRNVGAATEYRVEWHGGTDSAWSDAGATAWSASPPDATLKIASDVDGEVSFYIDGGLVGTYSSGVAGGFSYAAITGWEAPSPVALGFRDLRAVTVEGAEFEWPPGNPLRGWYPWPDNGTFTGYFAEASGYWQRHSEFENVRVYLGWPQHYERVQGCVRYGTLNTPWRYRNYAGLYEHRVIEDDTTQEATGGAAAALWPAGWVWPDGTHGVLYELGGDTVYRRASGPTWSAGATLGADRARPVATQLAPSNDLLIAWMDGAACKCKRLRWNGAAYATTESEYTIAASMVRPGSIDQLPDGRLVFIGENSSGVGYSLSSDDGATWSEFTALVAGAAYPVACRLGASQDLLMAYADQPWGEATISVCRVAWDGSAYAVAAGSTVAALELGGAGQHPMDYLNSVDAIFERASGVPVLLLSLFNRMTGTAGYYSALIMQSDDGGTTWTETLLS